MRQTHRSISYGLAVLSLFAAVLSSAVEQEQRKRPNILWIVGENLKLDLGCYGAKNVKTPNLDALAAKGVLFDTIEDPHEINNLANSNHPEHREALIRMRAALSVWMVETQDQGVFPEPAEVVAPFEKEVHDWFGTPDWYKNK